MVDDEHNLTELLSMALRYEGWEVRTASTGPSAARAPASSSPTPWRWDTMLPDFDGLEVLHGCGPTTRDPRPVPRRRDAVEDCVNGLTAGGDDYATSRSAWRRSLPGGAP